MLTIWRPRLLLCSFYVPVQSSVDSSPHPPRLCAYLSQYFDIYVVSRKRIGKHVATKKFDFWKPTNCETRFQWIWTLKIVNIESTTPLLGNEYTASGTTHSRRAEWNTWRRCSLLGSEAFIKGSAFVNIRVSPCGGGVEFLHRDPASRKRRRKGSLKSETVNYGREYQATRTRERLRWQGPTAYTKDRPVLSSERELGLDTETYWLIDCQSQCDFDFEVLEYSIVEVLTRSDSLPSNV
jgi:hypothetical protein